jgi:hypothetical protein
MYSARNQKVELLESLRRTKDECILCVCVCVCLCVWK